MIVDKEQLQHFESRYRAQLINSLAGVKQAVLVGTKSKEGISNLAIFNSLIHIGANPPLWGLIFRPDTVRRDTLNNLLETGEYTFNYVHANEFEKAHQTSAKFDAGISEFEACGFEASYVNDFHAPFIADAPVKVALKLEQKITIPLNNTLLLIGSIQFIEIDEALLLPDGTVALNEAHTLACVGLDTYCETRQLARLSYPKPDTWPARID